MGLRSDTKESALQVKRTAGLCHAKTYSKSIPHSLEREPSSGDVFVAIEMRPESRNAVLKA